MKKIYIIYNLDHDHSCAGGAPQLCKVAWANSLEEAENFIESELAFASYDIHYTILPVYQKSF